MCIYVYVYIHMHVCVCLYIHLKFIWIYKIACFLMCKFKIWWANVRITWRRTALWSVLAIPQQLNFSKALVNTVLDTVKHCASVVTWPIQSACFKSKYSPYNFNTVFFYFFSLVEMERVILFIAHSEKSTVFEIITSILH